MPALTYDPGDPALKVDPWSVYQRLREEAPVLFAKSTSVGAEDFTGDFYVLSRYDDVAMGLRDKVRFSSRIRQGDFLDLPAMVNRDAPDHTRLRSITNRAFGPRALGPLTGWMEQVIDGLVEELLSVPQVEFVDQFSTAVPLRVVGTMLGIPLDRKKDIQCWSESVLELAAVLGGTDPDRCPGFYDNFLGLVDFMDGQVTARAGCPARGDILSDLVRREASGEVTPMGWSYIAAGQDTTMNLISGGLHMMLTEPELAERLIADPSRTEDFIEEYLRFYSPSQYVYRVATTDVALHGVLIPAGSNVNLVLGSANRDPRMFPDPDVFDLDRPNADEHLGFGAGPHFCPGTALGRLMAGIAFRALYPHLDRLSLDPDDPARMRTRPGAFGLEHMGILVSQDTPVLAGKP